MPTVTNPLHLRPPVWVTPSRLPIVHEECPYTVQFAATDAQFYCCTNQEDLFPNEPTANWQMGHSSTSSMFNSRPTYPPNFSFPQNSNDLIVCLGSGETYDAITGSDGQSNEDLSEYELFEDDFCFNCISTSTPVPENLTLNRFTGLMSGTILELNDWANLKCPTETPKKWEDVNACFCPEGFYYDETNYATCGSESLNIIYPYRFTVVAFNSAGFSSRTFTLPIINNWSTARDYFVRKVQHTSHRPDSSINRFIVDGEYVDNETYLAKMKQKGYFPTEGC